MERMELKGGMESIESNNNSENKKSLSSKYQFGLKMVVLQPTTYCNIDCSYCYLPDKSHQRIMPVTVTEKLAEFIERNESPAKINFPITAVWHGGEPLSCGIDRFEKLLLPLTKNNLESKIRQNVQTNATLLNNTWCELFKEHNIQIGISIDGSKNMNNRRIDRKGRTSYNSVMQGVDCLNRNGVSFSIISVIGEENLDKARELYKFAKSTGCDSLCINIEEKEGENTKGVIYNDRVSTFWNELFAEWKEDSTIRIREFDRVLSRMGEICSRYEINNLDQTINTPITSIDIFPSIASNGDIVLLSPEFLGVQEDENYSFIVGNIIESPMDQILKKGLDSRYVRDYIKGVKNCALECPHYLLCRGGQASNKYFEHKNIATTETEFCKNSKKSLYDAIIDSI